MRERMYRPAQGLYGGGTAVQDPNHHFIYFYGGYDHLYQFRGYLYRYDTRNGTWLLLWEPVIVYRQLEGPRKKTGTGMVFYGTDKLILFGGLSDKYGFEQPGATYNREWTNEQYEFDLKKSRFVCKKGIIFCVVRGHQKHNLLDYFLLTEGCSR